MSQTLDRGLRILELVALQPRTIAQVADELGVHQTTALRLLQTLRLRGFVHPESDGRYRLGSAVLRLSGQALEGLDLRGLARPHMELLKQRCGETVHLGILEGRRVVYIEKVEAIHPVRMYSQLGATAPLHCTALAKSILLGLDPHERARLLDGYSYERHTDRTLVSEPALLDDLLVSRVRGFTRDDQEHEPGIHCVAAPVFDASGRAVAAMSISVPASRVSEPQLLGFVPELQSAATELSAELGWRPDSGIPRGLLDAADSGDDAVDEHAHTTSPPRGVGPGA